MAACASILLEVLIAALLAVCGYATYIRSKFSVNFLLLRVSCYRQFSYLEFTNTVLLEQNYLAETEINSSALIGGLVVTFTFIVALISAVAITLLLCHIRRKRKREEELDDVIFRSVLNHNDVATDSSPSISL